MFPQPLYRPADLRPAYQLRYGWTAWPSANPFPGDFFALITPAIAAEWEKDGIRVLEYSSTPEQVLFTFSTTPSVTPVILAARAKGRIQHHCRTRGIPIDFSRKLAVRSFGDTSRTQVEAYIRNQVGEERLAAQRFREMLKSFTVVNPLVDLSQPTESNSGRYWYNLHLVLVVAERYRVGDAATLVKIRDTVGLICEKKRYAVSTFAVMPDHLHLALRAPVDQSPEEVALAFLNNLAHVLGQRMWWQPGYYVGTFGEYGMAAVRAGSDT